MPQDKKQTGDLTNEQLLVAVRGLVGESRGAGSSLGTAGEATISEETAASVGDVLLHVVQEVLGVVGFVIAEVVTDFDNRVLHVIEDVTEHVVEHLIVDVVLHILLKPLPPDVLTSGEFASVLRERIAHAKVALELATQQAPAPSSRELAILRQVILKNKASLRTEGDK